MVANRFTSRVVAGRGGRACRLKTCRYQHRAVRSDALKDFRASHPYHTAIPGRICRSPSCGNGRRADEAPGPDRCHSAVGRPVPRRLERDPRASNASCKTIRNSWTGSPRAGDENPREISRSRIDPQNLQQPTPLALPNEGSKPWAEDAAVDARRRNRAAMIRYMFASPD